MSHCTPKEVASLIDRFLDGSAAEREWHDFTSTKCKDLIVEGFRLRINKIKDQYPAQSRTEWCSEEGCEALRQVAIDLRDVAGNWDDFKHQQEEPHLGLDFLTDISTELVIYGLLALAALVFVGVGEHWSALPIVVVVLLGGAATLHVVTSKPGARIRNAKMAGIAFAERGIALGLGAYALYLILGPYEGDAHLPLATHLRNYGGNIILFYGVSLLVIIDIALSWSLHRKSPLRHALYMAAAVVAHFLAFAFLLNKFSITEKLMIALAGAAIAGGISYAGTWVMEKFNVLEGEG